MFIIEDGYTYDPETGELFHNEMMVLQLKGVKSRIFNVFMKNKDNGVISKEQIITEVWGRTDALLMYNASLTQQIYLLRNELKKIGLADIITSCSKIGYRVNIDHEESVKPDLQQQNELRYKITNIFKFNHVIIILIMMDIIINIIMLFENR
ncbi:winged helix-turn-helix domain-containing protein [Serratia plymuthica]|uniref:winged helix-turn-helix domain-containing protein n=1 Tax=Serratia plymuthica TaxID=82996 RepID=UPI003DA3CDEF